MPSTDTHTHNFSSTTRKHYQTLVNIGYISLISKMMPNVPEPFQTWMDSSEFHDGSMTYKCATCKKHLAEKYEPLLLRPLPRMMAPKGTSVVVPFIAN